MIDYQKNYEDLKYLSKNFLAAGYYDKLLKFLNYEIVKTKKNKRGGITKIYGTKNKFFEVIPSRLRTKLFNLFLEAKSGIALNSKWIKVLEEVYKISKAYVNENIKIDKFDLIFNENVNENLQNQIILLLEKSINIIKTKGFNHLIYGKLFVEKTGHSLANYHALNDVVRLNYLHVKDEKPIASILHEFGHRHWYKFMTAFERLEYKRGVETGEQTITYNDRLRIYNLFNYIASETYKIFGISKKASYKIDKDLKIKLNLWLRYRGFKKIDDVLQIMKKNIISSFCNLLIKTKNKGHMKILAPTKYGQQSAVESFAVAFEYYMLNKPIEEKLKVIFLKSIKKS